MTMEKTISKEELKKLIDEQAEKLAGRRGRGLPRWATMDDKVYEKLINQQKKAVDDSARDS